jgi:hypothetical protein
LTLAVHAATWGGECRAAVAADATPAPASAKALTAAADAASVPKLNFMILFILETLLVCGKWMSPGSGHGR